MPQQVRLEQKLFRRELQGNRGSGSTPAIYGSKRWVEDLDIVGELRGHDGCVNALQWSRDGSLLATGSDDHRVNIYNAYHSFSLNTQIETGHTDNIFSVKFMPHSSDRIIVTAAGDAEVRVFDIEYAPATFASNSLSVPPPPRPAGASTYPRRRRREGPSSHPTPGKVHYDVHRVFRSHTDSVKRIITESSPNVFLTCSEDGTVRQFDLRQPSSTYSRPGATGGRRRGLMMVLDHDDEEEDERNPPLISYRQHRIDLNTISCSPSQPHYIALGGSHLYCFLHDRRMIGRDLLTEAGQQRPPHASTSSDDGLTGATRCVKKFAPRMKGSWDKMIQNSHITACKISDANPNEIVVSWSGDGCYLFDMNRSPDADEPGLGREPWDPEKFKSTKKKGGRAQKNRSSKKRRRTRSPSDSGDSMSGVEDLVPGSNNIKISGLVVSLRRELFSYRSSPSRLGPLPVEDKIPSYLAALRVAVVALRRINRASRELDEKDYEWFDTVENRRNTPAIQRQRLQRSARARSRRKTRTFVTSAGGLAKALATTGDFVGTEIPENTEIFSLMGLGSSDPFLIRFLALIVEYLKDGAEGVIAMARVFNSETTDILDDDTDEERPDPTDQTVITLYFRALECEASDHPIRDVDNIGQVIFETHKAAVLALQRIVELHMQNKINGTPLPPGSESKEAERKFWGERVGRALLMEYGEGLDFATVDQAFQGASESDDADVAVGTVEAGMEIDEHLLANLVATVEEDREGDGNRTNESTQHDLGDDEDDYDDEDIDEDEFGGFESDSDDEADEDDESEDEDDFWYRHRQSRRTPIEPQAPVWEHTKVYRGHCNVRTVKDVNFYGLNDEYVVSGSDCGHLFIWNKHTTELVQLLHGDDDTVNVAVGHPTEPLLAVSGIDYTVKLFSPDRDMQREFGEAAGESNTIFNSEVAEREGKEYAGKATRRRLWKKTEIMGQNEVMAENDMPSAVITRGMLQHFVARMRAGEAGALEGGLIPLDPEEGCSIM